MPFGDTVVREGCELIREQPGRQMRVSATTVWRAAVKCHIMHVGQVRTHTGFTLVNLAGLLEVVLVQDY